MVKHPTITADTEDAEIDQLAEEMWPVIGVSRAYGTAAFATVARALRSLLRDGMQPANAVTQISTIAMFLSGAEYNEVPGQRFRPSDP